MLSTTVIRRAGVCDLAAVLAIQQQAYLPAFHEARAAFAAKLARPRAALWLAEQAGEPIAYLLGFGCNWFSLPTLDSEAAATPNIDFWYWHDLAVTPAAQQRGVARQLLQQAQRYAADCASEAYLIAVDGAAGFWQRAGFLPISAPDAAQYALASYGSGANLMKISIKKLLD